VQAIRLMVLIAMLLGVVPADLVAAKASAKSGTADTGGETPTATHEYVSYEVDWDAYYTSLAVVFSLTDDPIPEAGEMAEIDVYKRLLKNALLPRFALLEASVYPMPALGCVIKHNYPDEYDNFEVSDNLNLIKAVTAGFEEPYALSFFTGNYINFKKKGTKHKVGSNGYMGYLFSVGDYHIKDNKALYDKWYEMEWKLKGDRLFNDQKLSWSFRWGGKFHEHPDITDTLYISLRRSRLDYTAPASSLWKNSGFEYTYHVSASSFKPVRHFLSLEKKWPLKSKKFALTLAVGLVWESRLRYTGDLERKDSEDTQIIVRPNINF
jgi:hypothetical protein